MPLKRPKPKKLNADELSHVLEASAQQTGKAVRQRTYDPDFPVFEVPVNTKVLAYIPNHVVQAPDGSMIMQMDKFAAHDCRLRGREFYRIRCTSGIVSEALGLDGSCPFCDSVSEVWDLVNAEYSQIVRSKGGNPDDESTRETYKADWQKCKEGMAVRAGRTYVTFPIVIVECEEKPDGKKTTTPKKDADGNLIYSVQWYTVAEKTYNEKWLAALDTVTTDDDTVPDSPAGLWAVLNYEYDDPTGKHDKMHSAQALKVGYKSMNASYDEVARQFDALTEPWTPAKAMEVVVDNVLRDGEEQKVACDEIMKSTRDKLAMFELAPNVQTAQGAVGSIEGAEDALKAFGATEVPQVGVSATVPSGVPQVGITTD